MIHDHASRYTNIFTYDTVLSDDGCFYDQNFKTRHSRFRARTSSANWAGTDELTTDEQQEYAKRMGYLE
ncbi:hypothetical protein JB92DRAFT_2916641 [Gautieria morchelliformis]|nr:hypothetical protein JB92DRAFT_2916641 [Gautieria morchelliformis]